MTKTTALAAFLAALAHGHAQSDLVINGSFETYHRPSSSRTAPGSADYGIPPGDTNIAGWGVINGPVAYVRAWAAPGGISSIDLSGNGDPISGGITQSVQTEPGKRYVLSFHMSGNPGASFPRDPSDKRMSVSVGGVQRIYSYDTATEENSFANMKWRQSQLLYAATSNLTKIEFLNIMGPNLTGPVIDNISLQECTPPLPSIQRAAGANVVVSWADSVCPLVLESSVTVGAGASWQAELSPVAHAGGRSFVTNAMSANRFFRLKLQ